MFKKIARTFNSISTKVILIIVALMLPLNIIAIMQSNTVIDTLIEQSKISSQRILDIYMVEIGTRMENTKTLLYYFFSENADFITMKLQKEENYNYQSSKLKVVNTLKNTVNITDGADGYFSYMKRTNDILIYDRNPTESKQLYLQIEDFITEQLNQGVDIGWHIYETNGQQYLFIIINVQDVAYGGWMNLEILLKALRRKCGRI